MSKKEFDIEYVARLARIDLSPSERKNLSKDLRDILSHVKKLEEVDVSGVSPTFQTTGLSDVISKDKEDERTLKPEESLSNAPDKKDGFFKIPKVL